MTVFELSIVFVSFFGALGVSADPVQEHQVRSNALNEDIQRVACFDVPRNWPNNSDGAFRLDSSSKILISLRTYRLCCPSTFVERLNIKYSKSGSNLLSSSDSSLPLHLIFKECILKRITDGLQRRFKRKVVGRGPVPRLPDLVTTSGPWETSTFVVEAELEAKGSTIASRVSWMSIATAAGIGLLILFCFCANEDSSAEHVTLFMTILLAGFGNLGAGMILSRVQHLEVFKNVSELLILEPTLLGLKGNIEMCMASRLATQAHLGHMDTWAKTWTMIKGNLSLDLTQATIVTFIASVGVVIVASFDQHDLTIPYCLSIVVSTSLLTACTASVILGSTLVTVIVVSYKFKVDPDNVGAPVAASLGDLITLSLLAGYAQIMYKNTPKTGFPTLAIVVIVFLLALLPIWFYKAYTNEYTKKYIASGWLPILIAVLISTCSGYILDYASFHFTRYAVFQPVINGVGGNLVAIHASRMSTTLHKSASLGELPAEVKMYRNPVKAFFDKSEINIEMARNLVLMALPVHITYIIVTVLVENNVSLTIPFLLLYLAAAVVQVVVLLYLAYHLVNLMWKSGIDPDNTSIPILTATGDFLGSLFLFTAFLILHSFDDINARN